MRKAVGIISTLILLTAFPAFASTDYGQSTSINGVQTAQATVFNIGVTSGGFAEYIWDFNVATSSYICEISVVASWVGTPTDSMQMKMRYGSSTNATTIIDTGSLLSTSDTQHGTASLAKTTFTFPSCVPVAANQHYTFTIGRTGTFSNTDKFQILVSGTGVSAVQYGGGVWVGYPWFSSGSKTGVPYTNANFADVWINGNTDVGAPVSPPVSFGPTVLNNLTLITDANASSTLATGNAGLNAFTGITAFLQSRVPFGYVWSIRDLFVNAATTSTDFGTLRFDYSDTRISTTTRAFLPGNLAVLSTSTVTSLFTPSLLAAFNSVISASILVGWLIFAFNRIKGQIVPAV